MQQWRSRAAITLRLLVRATNDIPENNYFRKSTIFSRRFPSHACFICSIKITLFTEVPSAKVRRILTGLHLHSRPLAKRFADSRLGVPNLFDQGLFFKQTTCPHLPVQCHHREATHSVLLQ